LPAEGHRGARPRHRMPHQRRGSLSLHTLAGEDHLVSPARRAGNPRRLARLPGLQRAAELRFDGRQAHRLRRDARAGDRAHAHRALGDGGRGHPDQPAAAPGPAQRYALPAWRRLDPLPRAEARPGAEEEEMTWLAVTVEVDAGAAEAMGDALLDAGAESVALEFGRLSVILKSRDDPAAIVASAAESAGLAIPNFSIQNLEDRDWVRASQAQFAPFAVGRLWIGASWHEPPSGAAAIARIDPGLAFGTGSHPTTRLVLGFLEQSIRGGERLLDYGCGSGILAVAAGKLGAARVDAVDIDPQAVEATAANAALNHVAVRALVPESLAPAQYDVVVSNILLRS